MTKQEAVSIFGSVAAMKMALGITHQAIYKWPEVLTQRQADRVMGAAARLGKLKRGKRNGIAKVS